MKLFDAHPTGAYLSSMYHNRPQLVANQRKHEKCKAERGKKDSKKGSLSYSD